ncbi:MAG: hyaluronate lyase [Verrucomicrobia bacterium]|nr:hyaluronate lyase [Verrucomicrobiota bacterium]
MRVLPQTKLYPFAALRTCSLALCLLILLGFGSAHADEYDNLRVKYRELLTGGTNFTADAEITSRINGVNSFGASHWTNMVKTGGLSRAYLWSDLASTNNSSHVTSAYGRLLGMATTWATKGAALQNNTNLVNDIIGALDWMYAKRYHTNYPSNTPYDNWWDWEVGAPQALNDTVVLVYSNLNATQISQYMNAVDFYTPVPGYTAANRTYTARVVALRGVIGKNASKLAATRDGLDIIFPYTWNEGFHKDGSFLQHGLFPYTGGYGDAEINDLGRIMYLLNGSTWAVTNSQHTNLYNWVYEAYEPMIYKGSCLDLVRGRGLSRSGEDRSNGHSIIHSIIRLSLFAPTNHALAYKQMTKYWIQTDTYRNLVTTAPSLHQTLLAKAIRDDTNIVAKSELIEHRIFPEMDRVVHRRPGWAAGLSMFSERIYNYESINGENLKGWHTSDGMLYLYNNDLSHFGANFWPTVNPKRMPGTTVDTLALANGAYEGLNNSKNWVGGADILGTYGATGMEYASVFSSLTAKKSWFMFDDEIVALGNGITSTDNRIIETIVENRKLNTSGNNAFTVNGTAQSTTLGWSATLTNVSWAHLVGTAASGADIGYYFPTATTLKAVREQRTNNWANIGGSATAILTNRFMTLWRDHGSNPANASYAYVLLPSKSSAQVSTYAGAPNISILAQSTNVHAVKENTLNLLAANFWTDGTNTVDILTSQQKASVLVKQDATTIEVAVSDPTQNNGTVRRVLAQDDSYVQDGSTTNTNFGNTTSLVLKSSGAGFNRHSYFKFDLSETGLSSATNVILKTYLTSSPDGPATIGLYQVTDGWSEDTITWNNKPAAGTLISSQTLSNINQWVSWDVTSYVNAQLGGDKAASFVLIAITSNKWVTFSSHETGYGPELNIASPNSGYIDLELARSAAGTISADSRVTVTQLSPVIKLRVDVNAYPQNSDANNGIRGNTWRAKFTLDTTAPTVAVTAPSSGANVRGPSVTVSANASDNVGVVGVQFKVDGVNIGSEDTVSPFTLSWNTTGVSNGAHTITAVARDIANNTNTSAGINIIVDNSAPTASITSPATSTRITDTINIDASASDNTSVAGVQFKLDGVNLGAEDTGTPFTISWNTTTTTDGTHSLTAVARDPAGNTTTSSVITVIVDNTGPSVSITAPSAGALVRGTSVSVSGTASDSAGVAGVQFKADGANIGSEDTLTPFTASWNTTGLSDGTHTLTAVARDTANNTSTSAGVNVTVDNTAPTVSLTAPLHGQSVNGFLTLLMATASDANGIAGIQFRVNGVNQGAEDTGSPFEVPWNTLSLANGVYDLSAVARDNAGNYATSSVASVVVANTLLQTAGSAWINTPVESQQSIFTFEFDASPSTNVIDGVMGLSSGSAAGYTNLACIVRFNTTGFIDARNGGAYVATNAITYAAGADYHFRLVVNMTNRTYTAYVTPEGSNEQLIGENYGFRTEQTNITVINNMALVTVTTNATLSVWNPIGRDEALVSWHRLDETFGSYAFDSTKNGNVGTLYNGATWVAGGVGGAVDLDGVNDHVKLPAAQPNFTNGLTLSLWLYSVTPKSWESFFNYGNGNLNQNLMLYRDATNAHVKFAVYNGTNLSAILVSNVLVLNQWQQLTVTVGPAGNAALYTNGVLARTGTVFSVPSVLRTNNFFGQASGGGSFHDGAIDDVRIYTRPLKTNEVFLLP